MIARILALCALLALPLAAPAPATCADPCTILATSLGYVAPATSIASGTSVRFVDASGAHTTKDGALAAFDEDPCFFVASGAVVTFRIADGALHATSGTETVECGNAKETEGAFALPFFCTLHQSMRGVLVVSG